VIRWSSHHPRHGFVSYTTSINTTPHTPHPTPHTFFHAKSDVATSLADVSTHCSPPSCQSKCSAGVMLRLPVRSVTIEEWPWGAPRNGISGWASQEIEGGTFRWRREDQGCGWSVQVWSSVRDRHQVVEATRTGKSFIHHLLRYRSSCWDFLF